MQEENTKIQDLNSTEVETKGSEKIEVYPDKKKISKKTFLMVGAVLSVLLLAIVIIFAFLLIRRDYDISASSAVEEASNAVSFGVATVSNSIDFTKFDPEKPLDMIDFDRIFLNSVLSLGTTNFLQKQTSLPASGDVTEDYIIVNFQGTQSELGMDLLFDMEARIIAEHKQALTQEQLTSKIKSLFEQDEVTGEELSEILLSQNFRVEVKTIASLANQEVANLEVYFTLHDTQLSIELKSLELSPLFLQSNETYEIYESIQSRIGEIIGLDIEPVFDILAKSWSSVDFNNLDNPFEQILKDFEDVVARKVSFSQTQTYLELNTQIAQVFTTVSNEAISEIRAKGNSIRDIVSETAQNTKVLQNFSNYETRRPVDNSTCTKADLATRAVFDNLVGMFDRVGSLISGQDFSLLQSTQKEDVYTALDSFTFSIFTCANNSDKTFNGFGINLSINDKSTSLMGNLKFEMLNTSRKLNFEFVKPELTVDFTQQLNELFEAVRF